MASPPTSISKARSLIKIDETSNGKAVVSQTFSRENCLPKDGVPEHSNPRLFGRILLMTKHYVNDSKFIFPREKQDTEFIFFLTRRHL